MSFKKSFCAIAILAVFGCGGGSGGPAPVAWWRAENNARDSAGTANGAANAGVTYVPGFSGQAFSFNGVDGAINVLDVPQLAIAGSMTIDAHVKVVALPSQAQGGAMIIFRGDDRGALDPYFLAVNFDGNVRFHINDAANAEAYVEAPIPVGRFVRVTAVLNDATGKMQLYLDGALAAELATTVRPFQNLDPLSLPGIGIGNAQSQPNSIYHYPFNGSIDELKVYNAVVLP